MADDELNWDNVPEAMARKILHQSEVFMSAQLHTALASDVRAVTAASIFVALATAVVGGTFAYWGAFASVPVLIAGLLAAVVLTAAACLCFWAARPILFYFPGNHPSQWWPCREADIRIAIGGETENYQERIEHNEGVLASNGRILMSGFVTALGAPLLASIAWLVATFSLDL